MSELEVVREGQGARIQRASNTVSAFVLVERGRVDGAIRKGFHNEASDLGTPFALLDTAATAYVTALRRTSSSQLTWVSF